MNNATKDKLNKLKREKWISSAVLLMAWDFIMVHAAYFLALWLRFDCRYRAITPKYLMAYRRFIPYYAVFCVAVFWIMRLYRIVWRYIGIGELHRIIIACIFTSLAHVLGITWLIRSMPLSYHIWGAMFQLFAVILVRYAYRFYLEILMRLRRPDAGTRRVMIIGAGAAGQMLHRDLRAHRRTPDRVVCFIDDDPNKHGRYIEGIPVVGGRDDILSAARKFHVDKIYLAIPSATAEARRDILNICKETDCKLMQLPGMYQLATGQVTVSRMKDVSVEDLLGREPIKADMKEVFEYINDRVVLVTGGGGSIGSELCRQIAAHHPRQLIIFDVYENNAYAIQLELKEKYPKLNLVTLIGSVRDSRRMFKLFECYRPQIVYHAAAHKHVPLMEDSPCEAIKNNALGTYKTAYAAMVHGCERFALHHLRHTLRLGRHQQPCRGHRQ